MKEKTFKQNFIWNSVGSFIYLFCQWLLTFFVIRLSNNLEDAGNLSLAISITNIFFNIACFNVRPYLVSDNNHEYLVSDYTTFRLITIIISIILCLVYTLSFRYTTTQLLCINLYMIYKIGEAIVDLFHAFEQRKGRMDIGGVSLLMRGLLSLCLFIFGLMVFKSVNISILLMIIVTYLFIIIYDYKKVKLFEQIKIKFNKNTIKKLFILFLPLAIGTFFSLLSTSLPRQFLEKMNGTDVLGIYATIATPAVIIQVAASYIYNPLLVTYSNYKKNKKVKEIKNLLFKSMMVMLLISLVAYIGSLFLSEFGLRILYGSLISNYHKLFSIIIIYTSLTGFIMYFHNLLIVFRKIKELLIIYFIGFISCISLSNYFISKYSMNGVSYVLIIYSLIIIIIMSLVIYKSLKEIKES